MMREYELTDEEYRTVLNALQYAKHEAVHTDAQTRFSLAEQELREQYEPSQDDD